MKKSKLLVILLLLVSFITACGTSDEIYNVTFSYDDGTTTTTVEVYENQMVSKPQNPTREGYIFMGWFLNEQEFDFSSKITKDITIFAKWSVDPNKEITWTVTFDANGGNPVNSQSIKDENKIDTSKINTTKDGYTFLGWYTGEEKFDFETIITKDITLTAKWEKIKTEDTGTTQKPTQTATYSYKWEATDSMFGQYYLFLTKNGNKISGTADITMDGTVVKVSIPATGKLLIKEQVSSIKNIKEN